MPLRLPAVFSDGCVLQQARPVVVWGWDAPGRRVRVELGAHVATALTDADGHWRVALPSMSAGGPYTLTVTGSSAVAVRDVLVGEVWVASGQSNMEWSVFESADAGRETAAADHPRVRLFKVDRATAFAPRADVTGAWAACTPASVAEFSAVAYHFARELHAALNVPVGIIQSAWGGTRVEAWTSEPALRKVMDVDRDLAGYPRDESEVERLTREHLAAFTAWEVQHLPPDPPNTGHDRGWHLTGFDDGAWPEMRLPTMWQSRGLGHNGTVWFRKAVELPPAWVGRDLRLTLGAVDDFDTTYVNGRAVGATPKGTPAAYQVRRDYRVPAAVVTGTRLVVAVRVFDHFGQGGFAGPAADMRLSLAMDHRDPSDAPPAPAGPDADTIDLAGPWRYQVEHAVPTVSADVFRTAPPMPWQVQVQNRAAALFNAMIHPLLGYAIRGTIWYQGESNVDKWDSYRARFTAMIRDWRARWGQGQFPFYFVQLAGFAGGPAWPYLQEAQAQMLSEPNTGMALAIDIGDPADIHPRNKRDVGRRLALLARHRAYGQPVPDRGPHLDRVDITGGTAVVRFRATGTLGTTDGDAPREFELAGPDGRFHPATVELRDHAAVLTTPAVPSPVAVRYAFRDAPAVNLTDDTGLPAEPFRTDGW